jgi:RNA polymerase sigma factor (sigma-70 family)
MKQAQAPLEVSSGSPETLEQLLWSSDVEMWEEVYPSLRTKLVRSVRARCYNLSVADAEEITDDAIFRVYKHFRSDQLLGLPLAERQSRFFGFVKQALMWAIADFFRQRNHGMRLDRNPDDTNAITARPRRIPDSAVKKALSMLNPQDRQLMSLSYLDGFTQAEIQEHYRKHFKEYVKESALKMRIARAKQRLQNHILEQLE